MKTISSVRWLGQADARQVSDLPDEFHHRRGLGPFQVGDLKIQWTDVSASQRLAAHPTAEPEEPTGKTPLVFRLNLTRPKSLSDI
jgi:hypothetical protein